MRRSLLILLLICMAVVKSTALDLLELRNLYYSASESRSMAAAFFSVLEKKDAKSEPVLLGYKGMAYMLQAKFGWNPIERYRYFNEGRELLDQAIAKAPSNVELRFLRLTVQSNVPEYLGYSDELEADHGVITQHWERIGDLDLKHRIREYLMNCKHCPEPRIW